MENILYVVERSESGIKIEFNRFQRDKYVFRFVEIRTDKC